MPRNDGHKQHICANGSLNSNARFLRRSRALHDQVHTNKREVGITP